MPVPKAPETQVGCEASWATVLMVTGVVVSLFVLTCAILFYCGGGGRWCTRNEPSDTPSSVPRVNGIKEQYPGTMQAPGNMYHQHHMLHHHHHLGLPPPHHVTMWSASDPGNCTELGAADLVTRVPPEYAEYNDNGLISSVKKPPSSAIGVYV
ncbi:hypothetical protein B566_EDAN005237 [Ephemera danica]|nr:hypothetical protein B566_EDAN005237 [Ephemera danica]